MDRHLLDRLLSHAECVESGNNYVVTGFRARNNGDGTYSVSTYCVNEYGGLYYNDDEYVGNIADLDADTRKQAGL